MPSEDVVARLRVDGEGPFAQAFGRARDAMRGLGSAGEESEGGMLSSAKGLAKAAGAAAVTYKAYRGLKDSVSTTVDLAKQTAGFARASGLSSKESQAWVTVAKSRGIETKQLQLGMATLGRNLGAVGKDGESTSKALKALGVSQQDLIGMPMADRMAAISESFAALEDGPEKAAAAQQLFGRSGQQLLPLLNAGAQGLTDQLDAAQRLVPPLGENADKALELAKQQRELDMAMQGVKTAIGTMLIPILTPLVGVMSKVVGWFARAIDKSPILKGVMIALAAGLLIAAAAMWVLNSAFLASPITWIILGIVAVVVLLIQFFPQLRDAAIAAFNWVKQAATDAWNWLKDIAGKIAAPFITAFDAIKTAITDAKNWIGDRVNDIVNFFLQLPGKIIGAIGDLGSTIKSKLEGMVPGFIRNLFSGGGVVAAQTGLTAGGNRNVLVGERGPELLSLPSGSRVTPLPPPALAGSQLMGGGGQIVTQVYLDRRMIAEAVADYTADQAAAR